MKFDGVSTGAAKAAAQTRASIKGVRDEASMLDKTAAKAGSTLKTALSVGAKAGALGVAGLAASVVFAGFKFDDLKQKSTIAFTTMLGSGQKAKAFLNDLQSFANKTPFEFPDLIRASQRMLAMGFAAKEVVPSLTAIGDASAALGGSAETIDSITFALGQMQNAGRVSAQDMNQLTQAGINGWGYLAAAAHKSVAQIRKESEAGMLDSRKAVQVILAGMESDYAGMMDKQSRTFSGLWSTIKDTYTQISGKVMQPFFDMATRGLQKIVDITSTPEFTAGVTRFADALSKKLATAAAAIVAFFRDHWGEIKDDFLSLGKTAADTARDVAKIATQANKVSHAIGGWDEAIKLALAAAVAAKLATFAGSLGSAAGSAALLRQRLVALKTVGVITLGIEFFIHEKSIKQKVDDTLTKWRDAINNSPFGFLNAGAPGQDKTVLGQPIPTGASGGVPGALGALTAGRTASTGFSTSAIQAATMPFAGVPYQWGGGHAAAAGPSYASGHGRSGIGLDCSGYARAVLANLGITVNGTADTLHSSAKSHPSISQLQPGDLVFYEGIHPQHVMVYIGRGLVIGETHTGATGPEVKAVNYMPVTGTGRYTGVPVNTSSAPPVATAAQPADSGLAAGDIDIETAGTKKPKKIPVIRGTSLLSDSVRAGIAKAGRSTATADDLVAYQAALKELRGKLATASGGQKTAIEEEITTIQKKINGITTKAYTDRLKAMAAETKKRLAEAKKAVDDARGTFQDAYRDLASKALDAYDRETQKRLDKIDDDLQAQLDKIDAAKEALTPEEQAAAAFKAERDAAAYARQRAEDVAARDALLAGPDDETPEDKVKRLQDLADAEQKIRDDDLDAQQRTLDAAADASRKARDKEAEAQQNAAQDAAATLKQHVQDERDIERQAFSDRLDELGLFLSERSYTTAGANAALLGLMKDFGLDPAWFQSGSNAGTAWQQGLAAAMSATQSTLAALDSAQGSATIRVDTGAGGIVSVDPDYAAAHGLTVNAVAALSGRYAAMGDYYSKLPRRAHGGKLPGQYVGLEDTMIYRGTPGEHVSDRELTRAMENFFLGGRGAVGATYVFDRPQFFGAGEREVRRGLAEATAAESRRITGYTAPRG